MQTSRAWLTVIYWVVACLASVQPGCSSGLGSRQPAQETPPAQGSVASTSTAVSSSEVAPAAFEFGKGPRPVIPHERLLTDDELVQLLDVETRPALKAIQELYGNNPVEGLQALAAHFRAVYAERYLFDWTKVDERFADYQARFPEARKRHEDRKNIHLGLYPADVKWKLPFKDLQGRQVTAYQLRHIARQHKVLDMAFVHLYEGRNPQYVDYFTTQMRSLNAAFEAKAFEDDDGGNGVFEVYRGGTRVLQWLNIHPLLLGAANYDFRDQIDLIRSLLLEGALMNHKNPKYRRGNHQTRGMGALGMLAILFADYQGTGLWYRTATQRLEEHLEREIYPDGFQFERTIHYHVSDIKNYFGLYQLAKLNRVPISEQWATRLKAMFDALRLLARPDGRLPVSSDDTGSPWSESNDLASIMLLGAILFDDPEINAFASEELPRSLFWSLRAETVRSLGVLQKSAPTHGSASLPDVGFYVMRDGWDAGSLYMNISAGLTPSKSDHQHGDMLGLTAYGRGRELLPNYTVRYFLKDLDYFKNSLSKNVAMVDSIPHGRRWTSNKGGSGFGKWLEFPQPKVISWESNERWDYFAGTHDGYEREGVEYYRKVLFLKGVGWVVKDIFASDTPHDYQQVWQGHYSPEAGQNHFRSSDARGAGLEILQLGDQPIRTETGSKRGKGRLVFELRAKQAALTTLLYPYGGFSERLPHDLSILRKLTLGDWTLTRERGRWTRAGEWRSNAGLVLSRGDEQVFFEVDELTTSSGRIRLGNKTEVRISQADGKTRLSIWAVQPTKISWSGLQLADEQGKKLVSGVTAQPGQMLQLN